MRAMAMLMAMASASVMETTLGAEEFFMLGGIFASWPTLANRLVFGHNHLCGSAHDPSVFFSLYFSFLSGSSCISAAVVLTCKVMQPVLFYMTKIKYALLPCRKISMPCRKIWTADGSPLCKTSQRAIVIDNQVTYWQPLLLSYQYHPLSARTLELISSS